MDPSNHATGAPGTSVLTVEGAGTLVQDGPLPVMNGITPPKNNMDTQNDDLEKVTPFKYGHFWYLC